MTGKANAVERGGAGRVQRVGVSGESEGFGNQGSRPSGDSKVFWGLVMCGRGPAEFGKQKIRTAQQVLQHRFQRLAVERQDEVVGGFCWKREVAEDHPAVGEPFRIIKQVCIMQCLAGDVQRPLENVIKPGQSCCWNTETFRIEGEVVDVTALRAVVAVGHALAVGLEPHRIGVHLLLGGLDAGVGSGEQVLPELLRGLRSGEQTG